MVYWDMSAYERVVLTQKRHGDQGDHPCCDTPRQQGWLHFNKMSKDKSSTISSTCRNAITCCILHAICKSTEKHIEMEHWSLSKHNQHSSEIIDFVSIHNSKHVQGSIFKLEMYIRLDQPYFFI